MRYLTVEATKEAAFLQAASEAGLKVVRGRENGPLRIIATYCCQESELRAVLPRGFYLEYMVEGGSRRILRHLPGVHKVHASPVAGFEEPSATTVQMC